jgi:hypothetical protein
MSTRSDSALLTCSAIGLCVLFAWNAADERERRVAAEERLRQIEWAAERPCHSKPGHRLVSTVNADSDGRLARWCGYYNTAIETVRIVWERAQ